ncbi:MAG: SURF1 family cytochrome oxidase biogenesis protein [Novosphingobium sp.]
MLIAVAVMVWLGVWQLDRLHQKEVKIAQFGANTGSTGYFDLNRDALIDYPDYYGRARVFCSGASGIVLVAGRNLKGVAGLAQRVKCDYRSPRGYQAKVDVVLGWSKELKPVRWSGGYVEGTVVPDSGHFPAPWHIVADPPLAGLQANARPDPRDLPNNHLSYAMQWFLFALTALVIYALALRKRLKAG